METNFKKRPILDIIEDSKTIDPSKISKEVLEWLSSNVENFIDNQTKMYKLDLILDETSGMTETLRMQNLYRAIDDEVDDGKPEEIEKKDLENCQKCRNMLNEIVAKSFEEMKNSQNILKQLFDRMIFYYEKVIPSPENKKKAIEIDEKLKELIMAKDRASEIEKLSIQDKITELIKEGERLIQFERFDGIVNITNFDYEAFNVGVSLATKEDQEIGQKAQILKHYVIPEGFVIWLEINYKHKQRPTNLF